MPYKQAPFGTTVQVKGGSRLTGSQDAIYIRNKYQTELDNAHASFVNMVHFAEDGERSKIITFVHQAEKLAKDITAHTSERENLYKSLDDLLEKELGQEYAMFKVKPQGVSVTAVKLGADVHVGAGWGSMGVVNTAPLRYLEKYPELQARASFSAILHKIQEKEQEIRAKTEAYNQEISYFNRAIPCFEGDLLKCVAKLEAYKVVRIEWDNKRQSCPYFNSLWFRLLPESKKAELLPDTITHRVSQFTHTLELFQQELAQYKVHKFVTVG